MRKPKVLLDVDGVLADFNGSCFHLLNDHFDLDITHDDITEWGWTSGHPKIPAHALRHLTTHWVHQEGFVWGMKPLPGAREAVKNLREIATVVCVTSPWRGAKLWTHERTEWLIHHFGFQEEDIIPTSGKHHVGGDVLVDDRVSNVVKWLEHHPGMGFVWAQPYNVNSPQANMIRRTGSWQDVIDYVAAL